MAITYEVRKTVVDAVLSGKSYAKAKALADVPVSDRSIYRWLQWHREKGDEGLKDNRHGVVWKVTDEVRTWLSEAIEETPALSARQLQEQLQVTFGIQLSISHINQMRADAGLSRRTASKKSPD
jgi:transposase